MDQNLVYAKTPDGDDAVRQSTRVVQRNLRLVLVQVDGKTSVAELGAKIGNLKLVENALSELEEGGFVAPAGQPPARRKKAPPPRASQFPPPAGVAPAAAVPEPAASVASSFSAFGKPILPTRAAHAAATPAAQARGAAAPEAAPRAEVRAKPRRPAAALLIGLLAGGLVLASLGVVFFPYDRFKPAIEAALAEAFLLPAQVGKVSLELLPRPALALTDVRLGQQAHIGRIRIQSPLSLLGGGRHRIPAVDLDALAMPADAFAALLARGTASPSLSLGRTRLQHLTLAWRERALGEFEGEIAFQADGRVERASLQSVDRTLRVEAVPADAGLMLAIEGLAWKPADDLPYVFESLQAKGLLQPGRLVVSEVDTTFMGGLLKGSWLLTWQDGLSMAGEAALARIDLRRLLPALVPGMRMEGEMAGSLRLRSVGQDWRSLWANLSAGLDADIARGVLPGVDLGEAARRGSGRSTRGGATKFDRLRAVIAVDPRQVSAHDVRLEAGMIAASGRFNVDRELRVDGLFDVSISSSVAGVRMPVKVSGSLPEPDVTAVR